MRGKPSLEKFPIPLRLTETSRATIVVCQHPHCAWSLNVVLATPKFAAYTSRGELREMFSQDAGLEILKHIRATRHPVVVMDSVTTRITPRNVGGHSNMEDSK